MPDKIIAQNRWYWCEHCGNLWHTSSALPHGYCAATNNHEHSGFQPSGDYALFVKPDVAFKPTLLAQSEWHWCNKCNGLWKHTTAGGDGVCPKGGAHVATGSGDYVLLVDSSGAI